MNLCDKMVAIEEVISSRKGYSAEIVDMALKFSQLLNPLIENCLKYFGMQT